MKRLCKCTPAHTYAISVLFVHNIYTCVALYHQLVIRSSRANWFNWILPRILIGTFLFVLHASNAKLLFAIRSLCVLFFHKLFSHFFLSQATSNSLWRSNSSSGDQQWMPSSLFYVGFRFMLPTPPTSPFIACMCCFSWYRFHTSNQAKFQCSNKRDCNKTTMQNTCIASTHFLYNTMCVCACVFMCSNVLCAIECML